MSQLDVNRIIPPGESLVKSIERYIDDKKDQVETRLDQIDNEIEQLKEEQNSLRTAYAQLCKVRA